MISNLDEDEDIELIWWYIYKKNIKNICLNKYIINCIKNLKKIK